MKEEYKKWAMYLLVISALIVALLAVGLRVGYKRGQADYSRGIVKYYAYEGVIYYKR